MGRPVYWRQGLFLQPQHFQLADMHAATLAVPLREFLHPHLWGVSGLAVREGALEARMFEIERGRFLFSDGTFVEIPGNGLLEPRSFEAAWPQTDRPLMVYVGLRRFNDSGANVSETVLPGPLGGIGTRFVTGADPEEIPDLHAGGAPGRVKCLSYVLKILFETEKDSLEGFELIPVARLMRESDRVFLAPEYVPPLLSIDDSETMMRLARDVRDLLAAKGAHLESFKSLRDLQTGEFETRYIAYIMALRSINRHIPGLVAACETRPLHPFDLHAMFAALIGELSSFADEVDVLGTRRSGESLPPYRHGDCWPAFKAMRAVIAAVLEEISVGPEYLIRLERDGVHFTTGDLPRAMFHPRNHFFLMIRTEMDSGLLEDSLETSAKLSSKAYLAKLVDHALPGIALEHVTQTPQEMPKRKDSHFFRIDVGDRQWEKVVQEAGLAMQWDAAPPECIIELLVLRRA